MTMGKLHVLFLLEAVLVSTFLSPQVAAQGCSNTCPPINFGTPVPSLCEGDLATESSANVDKEYTVCHPSPQTFRFTDFLGAGRVTVLSNVYIGWYVSYGVGSILHCKKGKEPMRLLHGLLSVLIGASLH